VVTWPNGVDIDPGWMYEQVRVNKSWSVPFWLHLHGLCLSRFSWSNE